MLLNEYVNFFKFLFILAKDILYFVLFNHSFAVELTKNKKHEKNNFKFCSISCNFKR